MQPIVSALLPPSMPRELRFVLIAGAALLALGQARRRGSETAAWAALGAGLALSVAGGAFWSIRYDELAEPPYPSWADACWLAAYPAYYTAIVLLARARLGRLGPSMWLDGVVVGLAFAALAAAVVFDRLIESTEGAPLVVATTLAYPLADLLLLLILVGVLSVVRLRGAERSSSSVPDSW